MAVTGRRVRVAARHGVLAIAAVVILGCVPALAGCAGPTHGSASTPTRGASAAASPTPAVRSTPTASPTQAVTPTPTAPAAVEPTADAVRGASPAARPGLPAVVERLRRPATATAQPDRSVVLEWAPTAVEPLTVLLAAPAGGTLDARPDGSVVVRDAAGVPVGAIAPVATATLTAAAPDVLELTAAPGAGLTLRVSDAALAGATWGEREGGRSLAVVPTDWVRTAGEAGLTLLQAQLVAAQPEAGSATMQAQLACHAVGAPDKARWNLEPWRPDVGLLATMAASCNP